MLLVEVSFGGAAPLAVLSAAAGSGEVVEQQSACGGGGVGVPGGCLPDNGAVRLLDFAPSAEGLEKVVLLTAQSTL